MIDAPTKAIAEAADISRRHARRRKAEGSATPQALTDRERFEKARADRHELAVEEAKIALARERGELISVESIAGDLRAIGEELKAALAYELEDQLPIINEGLSAEKQRHNNHAAFLRLLSRWREFAVKNGAKE